MKSLQSILSALTPVSRGDSLEKVVTATRINALQDAVIALASGENVQYVDGMEKTSGFGYVSLRPVRTDSSTVSSASQSHPWKIQTEVTTGTQLSVTMSPGVLNNVLPVDWAEAKKTSSPQEGATLYVYLNAETDSYKVTRLTWEIANQPKPPQQPTASVSPLRFSTLLALISKDGVYQIQFTNLTVTPTVVLTTSRRPQNEGDEPFIRYYAWQ